MSIYEFKQRILECRSQAELELLLIASWREVVGTFHELTELREFLFARMEALLTNEEGIPAVPEVQMEGAFTA